VYLSLGIGYRAGIRATLTSGGAKRADRKRATALLFKAAAAITSWHLQSDRQMPAD